MIIGFYGDMGEAMGREIAFDAGGIATVGDLRRALAKAYPQAAGALLSARLKPFLADRLAGEDEALARHGRIEFLPPLSGG